MLQDLQSLPLCSTSSTPRKRPGTLISCRHVRLPKVRLSFRRPVLHRKGRELRHTPVWCFAGSGMSGERSACSALSILGCNAWRRRQQVRIIPSQNVRPGDIDAPLRSGLDGKSHVDQCRESFRHSYFCRPPDNTHELMDCKSPGFGLPAHQSAILLPPMLRHPLVGIRTRLPVSTLALPFPTSGTFAVIAIMIMSSSSLAFPTSCALCPTQIRLTIAILLATTALIIAVSRLMWLVVDTADFGALFAHAFIVDYVFCPSDMTGRILLGLGAGSQVQGGGGLLA